MVEGSAVPAMMVAMWWRGWATVKRERDERIQSGQGMMMDGPFKIKFIGLRISISSSFGICTPTKYFTLVFIFERKYSSSISSYVIFSIFFHCKYDL
jgi:hypothetical protein